MDVQDLIYDFGEQLKMHSAGNGAMSPLRRSSLANKVGNMMRDSILRRVSTIGSTQGMIGLKAPDLVDKLKIFYNVGMTSLLHHLSDKQMRVRDKVQVSNLKNIGEQYEPMQFPDSAQWRFL